MDVVLKKPLDDRIVVFGMSCAGKTTFSQLLPRPYYCFDWLFQWHLVEGLGCSPSANLEHVSRECSSAQFVLDGWHLSDKTGRYLPVGAVVYVVYSEYDRIVSQYRVPYSDPDEFRGMFAKWYHGVDYNQLPGVRYFLNDGSFVETDSIEFAKTTA